MLSTSKFKQFSAGVLLLLAFTEAFATGQDDSSTQLDWSLEDHQKAVHATFQNADGTPIQVMGGEVNFVLGNHVWQPGKSFKDGANWLALACKKEGCTFEPATLSIKKETWQGHYDDQPTMGQKLNFRLNSDIPNVKVIAWFKTTAAPAWLKAGMITTYHSIINPPKKASSKGTFEMELNLANGDKATLVPILSTDTEDRTVYLQLRTTTKRQLLLGTLGNCAGVDALESGLHYLQWAGDLDSDGKADYLISFIDAEGPVHLYLSSTAKNGTLVDLAGVYMDSPFGGECDGGGW